MRSYSCNSALSISQCLELGILLEASAHKPGNVSVVTDFDNTRYEHFLASAVASRSTFQHAAERGLEISEGAIQFCDAGIGGIINDCVSEIDAWQHGGNTLLGTVLLLSPIAVAAGIAWKRHEVDLHEIRRKLQALIMSTTPEDAANVYRAIAVAKPSGLGKTPKLDINDPRSISKILNERTSLYKVFKIAEKYDRICSEWVNNYPITFEVAYPSLKEQLDSSVDINTATIRAFLEVLAAYPDTFIARKTDETTAARVSETAKEILDLGWPQTKAAQRSLQEFDRELRKSSNLLNPGTTADIIAASLSLIVLEGYRP